MDVYNIQDIPDRFFYKKGRFVSPLTLVAEKGWFIVEVKYRNKILRREHKKVRYMKTLRKMYNSKLGIEFKCYIIYFG